MEEIQQVTEILDVEDAANGQDVNLQEDEDSPDENMEQDVMYPKKFVVVGSWQEEKCHCALVICMWRRSANKELALK